MIERKLNFQFVGKDKIAQNVQYEKIQRLIDHTNDPRNGEDYEADSDLVEAVNTAIILGKPLLVEGDPGCGKTTLARRVAYELGDEDGLITCMVTSNSEEKDLLYEIDWLERMAVGNLLKHGDDQNSNETDDQLDQLDVRRFLTFQGLGLAIMRSWPKNQLQQWGLLQAVWPNIQQPPENGVVSSILIDEIDKAPPDFCNNLLDQLDNFRFSIPQLMPKLDEQSFSAAADKRPIVIISSNGERDLPEPFMRRCVYYYIEQPSWDEQIKRVEKRLNRILGEKQGSHLAGPVVDAAEQLAQKHPDELAQKYLSTSKLIDLALCCAQRGIDAKSIQRLSQSFLNMAAIVLPINRRQKDRILAFHAQ